MVSIFEAIGQTAAAEVFALVERRKASSGGPKDRRAHLAYQRRYEAGRKRFGVRVVRADETIETWHYGTRADADRARRALASGHYAGLMLFSKASRQPATIAA